MIVKGVKSFLEKENYNLRAVIYYTCQKRSRFLKLQD